MKTKFFMSIILLALGIATSAQTSKESANTIIINEFANRLDNYNIYVHHTALAAKRKELKTTEIISCTQVRIHSQRSFSTILFQII